jgi:hypothetical protein
MWFGAVSSIGKSHSCALQYEYDKTRRVQRRVTGRTNTIAVTTAMVAAEEAPTDQKPKRESKYAPRTGVTMREPLPIAYQYTKNGLQGKLY